VVPASSTSVTEAAVRPSSPAKARIVSAAVGLFAEHGVGGTSLQMIADVIGVTKAAVYHQFKTKDEIVIAAAEAELARLEAVLDAAAAEPTPQLAQEALLVGIVGLAVERRRMESTLAGDPVLARYFASNAAFRQVMTACTGCSWAMLAAPTRACRRRCSSPPWAAPSCTRWPPTLMTRHSAHSCCAWPGASSSSPTYAGLAAG